MKTAIKCIQISTINFLIKNLDKITDYREANELLDQLSGIDTFFRNQNEFLTLLGLLKPSFMVCEESGRREYGDFQTPSILTDSVCSYLNNKGIVPDIVIEPTFGKGSFLVSALEYFPKFKKIYGVEICESYYWQTKFTILELFLKNPDLHKPKIFLYLDDVFKFDFRLIEKSIEKHNVLVLGNPPWVTNSELGSLNSKNLPKKSNIKSLNGLDAITGKGNFDIGEYIILMMLNLFSKYNGHMAMLAKNSVIKNLIYDLPRTNYQVDDMIALEIDTKKFFDVSVKASLFECSFKHNNFSFTPVKKVTDKAGAKIKEVGDGSLKLPSSNASLTGFTCKVSSLISPTSIENEFGWVSGKFVSDVTLYAKNIKYDGDSPYIWRQGVKHDCSKIMELDFVNNKYVNGLKRELDLEKELIYGLVKSSDLDSLVITKPRKYVIITQKKIGEDTAYLSDKFPKLYQYLTENDCLFEQRKSSIYKDKPPFSIFGIGDYSFKPYKVAISGLYKRSTFSLILPENDKPVMLDDTCYFLGFDSLSEAILVWAILNSKPVKQLLAAIVFLDAKRPYTKDILMRISIDKIAKDMTYDKITDQIESLNENMLVNVTEDKWEVFLEKMNKGNSETKQLSLFEIMANPPSPFLTSTKK
jgi:hypothetical protein